MPFVFTLRSEGTGILLRADRHDSVDADHRSGGVCALAIGRRMAPHHATPVERVLGVAAGLLLMYPARTTDVAGLASFALLIALHVWRTQDKSRLSALVLATMSYDLAG